MVTTAEYKEAEHDLLIAEWRRGWRIHAVVYVAVNIGLIVLNVLLVANTSASFYWFPFPLVGWGIGLAMHYIHGVRRAEQEVQRRQTKIERRAEHLRLAA
jgi:2TM domain